jgi:hypothetical protein
VKEKENLPYFRVFDIASRGSQKYKIDFWCRKVKSGKMKQKLRSIFQFNFQLYGESEIWDIIFLSFITNKMAISEFQSS